MKLPRSKPAELAGVIDHGPDPNQAPRKIYNTLSVLAWFLDCICLGHHFRQRLTTLIDADEIDVSAMGFPEGWLELEFWKGANDE